MKFCVLGTKAGGAPLTSKHTSATALILGSETVLFDCSEGTQIQLLRSKISRPSINHIFISHLHGDHILGLLPLLTTMNGDRRTAPLHIYAPSGLEAFVRLGMSIMDALPLFPIHVHTLRTDETGEIATVKGHRISTRLLEHRIDSFGFRVEEPPHRNIDIEKVRAFGIEEGAIIGQIKREGSTTLADGRVIHFADIAQPERPPKVFVYCGDTRKCAATVFLAKDASVLLHEATFRDDMSDKAVERFHATSTQAAEVAREADVERLFLTHISVRYKSGLPILREARKVFPASFLAKELAMVEV
ncbi:MAG: ribonuclease Z [Candidatus Kapabacteria bacterium]|nr:ribonuclease Z [Candidatus Kapabacteria bacterium]